jgi:hypothetical protein
MNTRSNVYVTKTSSALILTILALSAIVLLVPVGVVHGSTGTATLGYDTTSGDGSTFAAAAINVSVSAGSSTVSAVDGAAQAGFFTISFANVVFSGSQFQLYVSKNGFSQVNASDIQYGPIFNTADFAVGTTLKAVNGSLPGVGPVQWFIGNDGTHGLIEGPIPLQLSNNFQYVKVFDGQTTSVAVSAEVLNILPGLAITPTSGPAGTSVSVSGGGFPSATSIVLAYSYSRTWWNGSAKTISGNWSGKLNTGAGYFNSGVAFSGPMIDTAQAINAPTGPFSPVPVTINANAYYGTPTTYASATFREESRFFNSIVSYGSGGTIVDNDNAHVSGQMFGNDTGTGTNATVVDLTYRTHPLLVSGSGIDAAISGTITVTGNYSFASSAVTAWDGATQLGTTTSDSSGGYSLTFTVPNLGLGPQTIKIVNNGVYYTFNIFILPTLILSPTTGPVGTTVTLSVYGFPANNQVWVFWEEYSWADGNAYNLVNGTTGANGAFTGTVSFTVPEAYGILPHSVYAIANSSGYTFIGTDTWANILAIPPTASANFTITSTLTVTPTSLANDGSTITATGNGLVPGCTASGFENALTYTCEDLQSMLFNTYGFPFNPFYAVSLDNFPLVDGAVNVGSAYGGTMANGTGQLSVSFLAAGFRPGLHVVSLGDGYGGHQLLQVCDSPGSTAIQCVSNGIFAQSNNALFTITTTGDPIGDAITSMSTSISGFSTSLANIQSSLTTLTGDVTTLQSSVTSLASQITTLSGTVSSAAQSASSAATAAQQAATAAQQAASNSSGLSNTSTYVLVVAVLAAITLVLELAILVRKIS